MEGLHSTDSLPARLQEVLAQIPDAAFAARLGKVYAAAASAIDRLEDLDLLRYELAATEATADLTLWEEMAPAIRDTVVDVNSLLMAIRENFPQHHPGGLGDTLAKAVKDKTPTHKLHQHRAEIIDGALQKALTELAIEITRLGERMRSPQVVSDSWNLLTDLQAFRVRFREQVGELVFTTACALADVRRAEVVPGHDVDLAVAMQVRSGLADLRRVIQSREKSIEAAEPEDVLWNSEQLVKVLEAFSKSAVFRYIRAQDKRQILEVRKRLAREQSRGGLTRTSLHGILKPFLQYSESFAQVSSREILQTNDREAWAACGVKIEQADQALRESPERATELLTEAMVHAQVMYGRNAALDVILREVRKKPIAERPPEEIGPALELFRQAISDLTID